MSVFILILIFALACGQLIKLPIFNLSGPILLDFVVAFLAFYGCWRLKFKLLNPPTFIKSILGFCVVTMLSLIFTPLHLTNSEFLISGFYIFRLLIYVLFGWEIYSQAFPEITANLNKIIIFAGLILAILGLLQLVFFPNLEVLALSGWDPHYFRTVSTFLDPNFLGAFLVICLIFLCQKLTWIKKIQVQYFTFLVIYFCLVFTFSRSSALMLITSFTMLAILQKSIKIFLLGFLLFGIMIGSFLIYQHLIATPRNINRTQSATFRLNSYQQGITFFEKAPILGIGFNAYKFGIRELNLADEQFLQTRGASSNDSSLLFVLSTTGIIGIVMYLSFLGSILLTAWKNLPQNPFNGIIISILVGLIAHSFFANSLFYPFIFLVIILSAVKSANN